MAERLDVAIVAPAFVYIPLWVAVNDGIFAAEGLDVHVEVAGGTTHGVTERLIDGRSQIGIGTPEGVLLDSESRLAIVAGHANRAELSLVAQARFTSIEALHGAAFGVASLTEGTAFILREILAQHGLHDGDYHLVEVGTHPVRWQALQAGTLDAALQLVPFNLMARDAGFSILAHASDYVPAYAFTTVNVRSDWAAANGSALERFLRALMAATAVIYEDTAASVVIAATKSGVPAPYVEQALSVLVHGGVVAPDLALDAAGLAKVGETLAAAGKRISFDPLSVVDLSWLGRARQEMIRA